MWSPAANGNGALTWIESISTENTRAPSFANNAARGLPTTSDLQMGSLASIALTSLEPLTY